MGYYLNQVTLLGKVGRDAEVKDAGASKVARFSIATSEGGYKKADGTEVPKVTQWHNIQCWNKLAELAGRLVTKGTTVAITGKITYREYEGKDGVKRSTTEIVANDLIICSGATEDSEPTPIKPIAKSTPKVDDLDGVDLPPIEADDLPF